MWTKNTLHYSDGLKHWFKTKTKIWQSCVAAKEDPKLGQALSNILILSTFDPLFSISLFLTISVNSFYIIVISVTVINNNNKLAIIMWTKHSIIHMD